MCRFYHFGHVKINSLIFKQLRKKSHKHEKSLKNMWMLCTNCCTFALQTKKITTTKQLHNEQVSSNNQHQWLC